MVRDGNTGPTIDQFHDHRVDHRLVAGAQTVRHKATLIVKKLLMEHLANDEMRILWCRDAVVGGGQAPHRD